MYIPFKKFVFFLLIAGLIYQPPMIQASGKGEANKKSEKEEESNNNNQERGAEKKITEKKRKERSRSRERDRKREKERSRSREKERKERSRSRERRSRSRERDRKREKERSRNREKERKERSRSRERRNRSRERDRKREEDERTNNNNNEEERQIKKEKEERNSKKEERNSKKEERNSKKEEKEEEVKKEKEEKNSNNNNNEEKINLTSIALVAEGKNEKYISPQGIEYYDSNRKIYERVRHITQHLKSQPSKLNHTFFKEETKVHDDVISFIDEIFIEFSNNKLKFETKDEVKPEEVGKITLEGKEYKVIFSHDTKSNQYNIKVTPSNTDLEGYPVIGTNNSKNKLYGYRMILGRLAKSQEKWTAAIQSFFPIEKDI